MITPNILDCTFRDGGYHTNWHFDLHTVSHYIQHINTLPVSHVEIGFVGFKKSSLAGPFLFTPPYLRDYFRSKLVSAKIGVMINFSELLSSDQSFYLEHSFSDTFLNVDFARIAVSPDQLNAFIDLFPLLPFPRDIEIHVNIMQYYKLDTTFLISSVARIAKHNPTAIYFADSLGNTNFLLDNSFFDLVSSSDIQLGFHAHNNQGLALANSLAALTSGFKFIDCTFSGLGRGAGNLSTEQLISNLFSSSLSLEQLKSLEDITKGPFAKLASQHNCGYSPLYSFAAQSKIHPTYVQSLLARGDDSHELCTTVYNMSRSESNLSSYISADHSPILNPSPPTSLPYIDPSKPIVIIGSASVDPFTEDALKVYKNSSNATIIAINSSELQYYPEIVDFRLCINPSRLKSVISLCVDNDCRLISSRGLSTSPFSDSVNLPIIDLGLSYNPLQQEPISPSHDHQHLPSINKLTAMHYISSLITFFKFHTVFLVGISSPDSSTRSDYESLFSHVSCNVPNINLSTLSSPLPFCKTSSPFLL